MNLFSSMEGVSLVQCYITLLSWRLMNKAIVLIVVSQILKGHCQTFALGVNHLT